MIHVLLPLALALAAAFAYATAAAVQRDQTAVGDGASSWRVFLRSLAARPRWWAGVAAMVVGSVLHVVALGVGSVTLVQPVGALALVLALPLDARLSHRRVVRGEWVGAGLLVAGLAGVLAVAPRTDRTPLPELGPLLLTLGVVVGALVAVVLPTAGTRPPWRALARAAGAGLCMGTTSASVHIAIEAFTDERPHPAIGIVSGVAAVVLPLVGLAVLQLAYREGGLDGPLATLTILDPVVATTIGIALLGERLVGGLGGVLGAGAGGVVALVGLTALVRLKPTGPTPASAPGGDGSSRS